MKTGKGKYCFMKTKFGGQMLSDIISDCTKIILSYKEIKVEMFCTQSTHVHISWKIIILVKVFNSW